MLAHFRVWLTFAFASLILDLRIGEYEPGAILGAKLPALEQFLCISRFNPNPGAVHV